MRYKIVNMQFLQHGMEIALIYTKYIITGIHMSTKKIVVIGNGMVSHRFCEKILENDSGKNIALTVFGEEEFPAYDRVHLSEYFGDRTKEDLFLSPESWYKENGITLYLHDKVIAIDKEKKVISSSKGQEVAYDELVFATGSAPFVPDIAGNDKMGVFTYRTIQDLKMIKEYSKGKKNAAVIGGGLLGLEAAKALIDLGLKTYVIEAADKLMPRQLDEQGAAFLKEKIESLGVSVLTGKMTSSIDGNGKVTGMTFSDKQSIAMDMIVISAGIIARDNLARNAGLKVGERGGIIVDDELKSSDPNIYAIGEVALHANTLYGLVAPGYSMAEILAGNLCGKKGKFVKGDLSTKLKIIGIDVASFGDALNQSGKGIPVEITNKVKGIYKKLILSEDGKYLNGGILVGDASNYTQFIQIMQNKIEIPDGGEGFLVNGSSGNSMLSASSLPDSAQICSCNNVSKKDILFSIREKGHHDMAAIKSFTKAGTTCGGCIPAVNDLLKEELKKMGKKVSNHVCEHFQFSRQELFHLIKIKKYRNFQELVKGSGKGTGCEVCKPLAASLFAMIYNDGVQKHHTIQDTNDQFMANIQKGGTYSIVPRIPGGEITPDKLIVLGQVAKKFDLFCKFTGAQRIDMFGARVEELPLIWKDLVEAGFQSGHAYGKALRMVKSCVGSTWCRFGVGDSVGLAVELENRYNGIRAPHKFKSAVSGCVRECAEAQSKDFGIIATEKGWNLYVAGNGGVNPQHAVLFASDIDKATLIKYIDRYLMYYIQTADKLTRTATWFNNLEGGLDYLKDVIINDSLGICEQLEKDMQGLIKAYSCEWAEVVNNPELQKHFRPFVNTTKTDETIKFVPKREMKEPLVQ